MSQQLINIFLILFLTQFSFAQEGVSSWLQRMGCVELQATYLEEQLENGNRTTQVKAAKQLADVYATMLARADQDMDKKLLQRAIELFDRIPAAGTVELRLQLFRATYIAAEQILERYRLRISDREEARIAITQLQNVTDNLESFRQTLLKRVRSARSNNEHLQQQLGLVTSYLAWTRYYIAWFDNNKEEAEKASQLFAEILLGDRPSLQSVSLDLKHHESGARAILGIALCKSILQYPSDPEPWFEELEDPETWSSVRSLVPLWKFFLLIDQQKWDEILVEFDETNEIDKTLLYRVSAVHSLENYASDKAKDVAKKSLEGLIEIGQLGILSDIVHQYGSQALQEDGFISKYIDGDFAFKQARDDFKSDEPARDEETQLLFASIAEIFHQALQSSDVNKYEQLEDDCKLLLGLSLYYASQFQNAAEAFIEAAQGGNKEQAIWMAIVSLDYLNPLPNDLELTKEELSTLYLENWPNTEHATQLTIRRSEGESQNPENIEDLLAIPHSDPKYEDAQRQAARSLYLMWQSAITEQQSYIGNRYITVALPLMVSDSTISEDAHANEVSAIRALRMLEISLHPQVQRVNASIRALETLELIHTRNIFSLQIYQNEIAYRRILSHLLQDSPVEAMGQLLEMIEASPDDRWTNLASKQVWRDWSLHGFPENQHDIYVVGISILKQLKNTQYGHSEFIPIAYLTAQTAYQLFLKNNDLSSGEKALEISRVLVIQQPKIAKLLIQNAELENTLGDSEIALQRWKTISSGSPTGSELWLRARFNTIRLISEQSPEKALAVLNQHHTLYPNYGVEPYGTKLRELHTKLRGSSNGS